MAVGDDPALIKTLASIDAVTLGDLTVVVEEEGTHIRKWCRDARCGRLR